MPMDIELDSNGDLSLTAEQLQLTSGAAEVAQRLDIALSVQLGEWFIDTTLGVRYFDDGTAGSILVKNPDIPAIVAELKAIIVGVEGVDRLLSFVESFSTVLRSLSVTFSVLTTDGDNVTATASVGDSATSFDPEAAAGAFQLLTINGAACQV